MRKNISFNESINSGKKLQTRYISSNKLVTEYSKDYSIDINKLYKYHLSTSPKTESDKARFKFFTNLYEKYEGDLKKLYEREFQISISMKKEESYYSIDNFEIIIYDCFSNISYLSKHRTENKFVKKFIGGYYLKYLINIYNKIY